MLAPMWHVNRDNTGRIDGITKCDDEIRRRVNGGNSLNRRWLEGKREQNPYVSKEGGGKYRPSTLLRLRPTRNLSRRVETLRHFPNFSPFSTAILART